MIADWHIDNHLKYNPTPNYRLNHSLDIARRLIEIIQSENIEELWSLGDLINKAVNPPNVMTILEEVLDMLSKHVKIRYFNGNHDVMSRAKTNSRKDSVLAVFHKYMEYMGDKIIEIDGNRFAFCNYQRVVDHSWIKGKCDVLLGHISLGWGQKVDNSLFKMAFYGDIHNTQTVVDRCYSIGCLTQAKVTDEPSNSVVILDTKTLNWRRYELESDSFKPFRLYYHEEPSLGIYYNEEMNSYFIPKRIKHKVKTIKEASKSIEFNFSDSLNAILEKSNLLELHKIITQSCNDYNPIDLDFEIMDIDIKNIKGIKDFKYNFVDDLLIYGKNGSGKSSFIIALYQGLGESLDWKRIIRKGTTEQHIKINIKYQNKIYKIKRSPKFNYLKIDDVDQKFDDVREFRTLVKKHLPFLNYLSSYYFNYWNSELFGEMNKDTKLKLISKFNNLDVFDSYSNEANKRLATCKQSLKDKQKLVDKFKTQLEIYEKNKKKLSPYDDSVTEEGLGELKSKLLEITNYLSNKSELDTYLLIQKELTIDFDLEGYNTQLTELTSRLSANKLISDRYKFIINRGPTLDNLIKTKTHELEHLQSNENKCSKCGAVIDKAKYDLEKHNLTQEVMNLNDERSELMKEYQSLKLTISAVNQQIKEDEIKISELNTEKATYDKNQEKMAKTNYQELITNLTELVEGKCYSAEDKSSLEEEISSYEDKLTNNASVNEIDSQIEDATINLSLNRVKRDEYKTLISELTNYIDLISKSGPLYNNLLTNLAQSISNDSFKFRYKEGDIHASYYYERDEEWKSYDDCSSGQKSLVDIYFLKMIIPKIGVLVFDEYFRYVDDDNLLLISEMFDDFKTNLLILSSHSLNIVWEGDTLGFPID